MKIILINELCLLFAFKKHYDFNDLSKIETETGK